MATPTRAPKRRVPWLAAGVIAATGAAALTTACSTTSPSAVSPTTSTTAVNAGPESQLVPGLHMPRNAIQLHNMINDPSVETWREEHWTTGPWAPGVIKVLAPQLPLHQPYHGIPWCKAEPIANPDLRTAGVDFGTFWSWGRGDPDHLSPEGAQGLAISVYDYDDGKGDVGVQIVITTGPMAADSAIDCETAPTQQTGPPPLGGPSAEKTPG
jgi:hypothetical protein